MPTTLLFAWELGAGLGHLAPYRTLTGKLSAAGHHVVFAVRDVPRANKVFQSGTVTCIQAPVKNYRLTELVPEPATYAQVLRNFGYGDPVTLAGMVSGWSYLLESVKPDLVVLDHSPTALLALRGTPLRRMLVGHGFFCPPDVYPLPVLRPWLNVSPDVLRADEDRVLASMNAVLQRMGATPLRSIGQLFAEVDENILTTVPELDPYPQRQSGKHWGLIANYPGDAPEWPAGDGRKVFCYLKHFDQLPAFLKALNDSRLPTVFCPDRLPEALEKEYASASLRFEHRMLDLGRVAADASCAVVHGGVSLLQFLLAGKPILSFPVTLENYLPCAGAQRLGAGLMVDRDDPSQFAPKLAELLGNEKYAQAAQAFAARYAHLDPARQGEKLARRIEEVAQATLAPDRFRAPARPAAVTPGPALVSGTLRDALAHHHAGRLRQAAEIYQSILAREPLNVDALHLAGVLALQAGNPRRATELIARAIALRPNASSFHNNQGEAFRLLGQLDQAENCYRAALRLRARYPEAANNLGLVLKLRGQHDDAIAWLQKALQWQPDYALAANNLGVALQERGSTEQALASFRRAVEIAPAFPEALSNLGQALLEAHAPGEALPCSQRAVELRPNFAPAHNNLGNVLRELGQLAEAKACYLQALRLSPKLSLACNNMGQAFQEEGAFAEAVAWYQRGLQLEPASARIHANLASLLEEQEKYEEAVAHHELALRSDPSYAEAHSGLGSIARELNKLDDAMAHYRDAARLKPGLTAAHCGLGEILEELGKFPEAEACFREALKHDPRSTGAYAQLAVQLRGKLPEADVQAMRNLLSSPYLSPNKRAVLRYGLAQVLDAQGTHDEAAACLAEANAQRKATWEKRGEGYDPSAHTRYVDELIATFTPEYFERTRGFGVDSERPVFIVGLPRSSTTLTEQILASHSQVFGAGELRFIHDALDALPKTMGLQTPPIECLRQCTPEAIRTLGQRHLERLQSLNAPAPRVTDKMPDNYLNVGVIATLFPKAKIIHCRRDLRDVAVSCWMTNFRHIRWACDTEQIAARFREYIRVMNHWRTVLPGRMLEVDYEDTVADLESVARRLVSWVGLEWEPACLAFHESHRPVRTASVTQVRQPIHKRSLQRWKNYEKPLGRLFEQLQALQ